MKTNVNFYAQNARQLLESRQNGLIPAGPVVVSLVGGNFTETALFVRDDMPLNRLDWRMLVDLDVWVWATKKVALSAVLAVTHAVAKARPKTLFLRFEDAQKHVHDVDVGSGWHHDGVMGLIPPCHEFLWWPQRTCSTDIGSQLQRALCRQHPERTYL